MAGLERRLKAAPLRRARLRFPGDPPRSSLATCEYGPRPAVRCRAGRDRAAAAGLPRGAGPGAAEQRVWFRFVPLQIQGRGDPACQPPGCLGMHKAGGRRVQDQVGPKREGLRGDRVCQRCKSLTPRSA